MKKIFLAGVFDMFHIGHLALIINASALGELTVGIVCDNAVKRHKGKNRPIISELDRGEIIRSLKFVDRSLYLNNFEFTEKIIEKFDIIVVGEDQSHFKNIDKIPPEKKIVFPRYQGVSTSQLIKSIKEI